ncbi:MAG: phage holin family protein [Rhodobacteraceae bacterium]|uniref:phage holin family protein n=1 Tax=Amaricoccus sp. B4 TaxID=3368557 RepID=UPI000DAEB791|nr:phage holin family protein [Paracoccaceae bacterium]
MLGEHLLFSADLRARRLIRSVLWSVLALVMALGGLGFIGASLWTWFASLWGSAAASLVVGLIFLAVALFGVLMASFTRSMLPPPRRAVGIDDLAQAFLAAAEVGRTARRK